MTELNDATTSTDPFGPSIADPVTCGEDLAFNLTRTIAIAPELCAGCADYHILSTARRLSDLSAWRLGARERLLGMLQPRLAELAASDADCIDVVVAACADTAVLSTCAQAAFLAGDSLFGRARFTVIDRCRTPLLLCEEYGLKHGLQVQTETVDLFEASKVFPADIIVLHNLLSFVPADRRPRLLQNFEGWLKDGGCIVLWNVVSQMGDIDRFQVADIKAKVEDGSIEINQPKETFFARLDRNANELRANRQRPTDAEYLSNLIKSVGLEVRSAAEVTHVGDLPDGSHYNLLAVTAVAGRPVL